MPWLAIALFLLLQVGSGLLYKYGAMCPDRRVFGFIAGNVLGVSSIYYLMEVYRKINPNVGEAICRGGYFILIQIAFILVFQSKLSAAQWLGVLMITGGICLVTLCRPG